MTDLSPDRRSLIQHLFAEATGALERAQTLASKGQSHRLTVRQYRNCATRLDAAVREAAVLAGAVRVLIDSPSEHADG